MVKDRKTIIKDLKRFIQFDSVCTRSNDRFAGEVGKMLARGGFRVSYQRTRIQGEVYTNVIGTKGKGARPFLICSHLDTVPSGPLKAWTKTKGDPWNASYKKGYIYGLGSADDKGPLLAMIYAGSLVPENKLKRPLMVMGTFGEENGMGGAKHFIRSWKKLKPVAVIAGEPTGLTVTYRHKGMAAVMIELVTKRSGTGRVRSTEFIGKQGHSSRPAVGVCALAKAVEFLRTSSRADIAGLSGGSAANIIPAYASLETVDTSGDVSKSGRRPVFPAQAVVDCYDAVQTVIKPLQKRRDTTIDPPTLTSTFSVARTEGPTLTLILDFRLLPGQSFKQIYPKLNKLLTKKLARYPGLSWKTSPERDNLPLGLDLKHPLVRLSQAVLKKSKLPVVLRANPGCTEAGVYHAWGVPAVVAGPGEAYGNIHSPNEEISVAQMEKAVHFYQGAIEAVCVEGARI